MITYVRVNGRPLHLFFSPNHHSLCQQPSPYYPAASKSHQRRMVKSKTKGRPPEPQPPTDEEIESESEPRPEEPATKSRARKVTRQRDRKHVLWIFCPHCLTLSSMETRTLLNYRQGRMTRMDTRLEQGDEVRNAFISLYSF